MKIEMTQDQIDYEANWPMPDIKLGDQIQFFKQWNSDKNPVLGFVTRISSRSSFFMFSFLILVSSALFISNQLNSAKISALNRLIVIIFFKLSIRSSDIKEGNL